MSAGAQTATARSVGSGWLYGPWTDLLIGCGLSYLVSLPLLFAIGRSTGAKDFSEGFVLWFGVLISGPHYGATILRVYEGREERRKYAVLAVYVTLALALAFVASSRSLLLASLLVTAYITWSPWHFSGQNYGLMQMFLRRRGIPVDPITKRLTYASFVLSALLAILALYGGSEGIVFAPATLHVAGTPNVIPLRIPAAFGAPLFASLLALYLGCVAASVWRLLRYASLAQLAPALLLVVTQSLWFTVPAALPASALSGQALFFSAVWISAWHSLQYLWVTAYYARSSGRHEAAKRFLLKATVAGAGVTALPGLIMSPQWLGRVPWDAGLAITVFSVVNLHHFILDGAIWKLRDGRVARVLLRPPEPDEAGSAAASQRRPWLRALVWTIAALALVVPLGEIAARSAIAHGGPSEQIDRWTRLLGWLGRETTQQHYWIGKRYASSGYDRLAIANYERSLELFPTGRVYLALAGEYQKLGRYDDARAAYESAIASNPDVAAFHFGRAESLIALARAGSDGAALDEAVASLERALSLRPGFAKAAVLLARTYAARGQGDQAIHALERALAAREQTGERELRDELARLRN